MMIACCFFATQSFCQEVEKEEDPDAAIMTFDEMVHDFGIVPVGSVVEWSFKFSNTGKKPIIVQRCSVGCSCTVPNCPKDTDQIMPGESREIKMKYERATYEHKFEQSVTVVSSAKNSPVRLTIKGEVSKSAEKVETSEK